MGVDQIATSSTVFDNAVHVWDVKQRFVPAASFLGHKDVCTSMLWLNEHVSLTAAREYASAQGIELDYDLQPLSHLLLTVSKDYRIALHVAFRAQRSCQILRTTAMNFCFGSFAWVYDPIGTR